MSKRATREGGYARYALVSWKWKAHGVATRIREWLIGHCRQKGYRFSREPFPPPPTSRRMQLPARGPVQRGNASFVEAAGTTGAARKASPDRPEINWNWNESGRNAGFRLTMEPRDASYFIINPFATSDFDSYLHRAQTYGRSSIAIYTENDGRTYFRERRTFLRKYIETNNERHWIEVH